MPSDLEKIAAVEAAAAQKLKAIRQKKKALKRADDNAKKLAIGDGIQRAVKAGDMTWNELKTLLKKHISNKKDRALLELDNTEKLTEIS